jgi:hypothetical protein
MHGQQEIVGEFPAGDLDRQATSYRFGMDAELA